MVRANSEITEQAADIVDGGPISQEIVLKDGSHVVVKRANPDEVLAFLSGAAAKADEQSAEETMRQMVTQVFTGETAEEILGVGAVVHVKDYLDRPVTLLSVDWRKSAFVNEAGENVEGKKVLPIFAVIRALDIDRKEVTLTTGAFLPCSQMFHMDRQGVLSDLRVKFIQRDRQTSNGFRPINMVAAD